jgi:hypothetical protein
MLENLQEGEKINFFVGIFVSIPENSFCVSLNQSDFDFTRQEFRYERK